MPRAPLAEVAREWTRIGCLGFGGPPAHIAMLRELCVEDRGWIDAAEFEHAIAATGLLPGPGSTQMALYCGWRVAGTPGLLVAGAGFVLPGLVAILGLAAVFLASSPPAVVRGAGAGAGAAVAAVAVHAARGIVVPGWSRRAAGPGPRWYLWLALGFAAAATLGPWLVLVLLGAGALELVWRRGTGGLGAALPLPLALAGTGGLGALAWVALKVGALSYGGGFVIVPLMQADAVERYGWLTDPEFLGAVALGQVTPGPVVHTVAAVGYAAAGVGGALLAAAVAFAPSFAVVLLGARHFDRLRESASVLAFLDGAGPAAAGAIAGAAIPLALALSEPWQAAVLAAAALALLVLGRGIVGTLVGAGLVGATVALAGGPVP